MGRGGLELAQVLLRVAPAWHIAGSSTPNDLWVNDWLVGNLGIIKLCDANHSGSSSKSIPRGPQPLAVLRRTLSVPFWQMHLAFLFHALFSKLGQHHQAKLCFRRKKVCQPVDSIDAQTHYPLPPLVWFKAVGPDGTADVLLAATSWRSPGRGTFFR